MCFAVSSQRRSCPQVPVSERCRLSVVYRVCESRASVQDVLLVFLRPKSVIEVHVEKTAHESDTAHGQQECEAQSRRAHYEYGNARASAQIYFASLLAPNTLHTSHTQLSRTIHAHTHTFCVLQMLRTGLKRMEAQDGDAWIWSCASLLVRQQVVFAGMSADRGVHLPHQ